MQLLKHKVEKDEAIIIRGYWGLFHIIDTFTYNDEIYHIIEHMAEPQNVLLIDECGNQIEELSEELTDLMTTRLMENAERE